MNIIDLSGLEIRAADDAAPKAPLRRFEEDPDNPRTEFEGPEFESFIEDIKQRGILQPIVVKAMPSGQLRIRFGARRFRAAQRLGLDLIPYVVAEDERQMDGYAQVSENEKRSGLQPHELAVFIKKRLDQGESRKDIAVKIGVDPSAVTHLLALVELPTFLQELYETRRCRTPQYLYKLRSLSEERPDLVRDRVREASRIDAAFVNGLNEEIKGPRPVPVAPPPSPTNSVAGKVIEAAPTDPGATKSSERVRQANKKGQPKSDAVADHVPDPVVRATYRRRPVSLVLSLKPSAKGHVFVQHAGGLCEQVAFEQLQKLYVAEG